MARLADLWPGRSNSWGQLKSVGRLDSIDRDFCADLEDLLS
jgi:hypothetical protein